MTIRILLVDDHPLTRGGIRFALESEDDFNVIGEASNGEEAIRLVGELRPDVVLMDLAMPIMDGVEATRRIHRDYPASNVIVFTAYVDDEKVIEALRAGALSFILKDAHSEELFQAVRLAYQGNLVLEPAIALMLFQHFNTPAAPITFPQEEHRHFKPTETASPPLLTDRELEVLGLLAQGLANKEIGIRLVISERTVKFHVSAILGKLGATNRTEAVSLAAQRGLINLL